MPALPAGNAGSAKVMVSPNTTMSLAPGAYGFVKVQKGATLVLAEGSYAFKGLSLGPQALLQYDLGGTVDVVDPLAEMSMAPTERTILSVVGDLTMGPGASITSGSALRSNRIKVFVSGSTGISFGSGGVFHGSLIAPSASVSFDGGASLAGAVYAKNIDIGAGVAFQPHAHPVEALLPSAPVSSLMAGPQGGVRSGPVTDAFGLSFALAQNRPNPVHSAAATLIRFALPEARDVRLEVFDVTGRVVKTLAQGSMGPGLHSLSWNGTAESGSRLPSGVYMYRLIAGHDRAQRKMILID